MRKLIWLALALGTAELLKCEAAKRGITPPAYLSNLVRKFMSPENAGSAPQA